MATRVRIDAKASPVRFLLPRRARAAVTNARGTRAVAKGQLTRFLLPALFPAEKARRRDSAAGPRRPVAPSLVPGPCSARAGNKRPGRDGIARAFCAADEARLIHLSSLLFRLRVSRIQGCASAVQCATPNDFVP